MDKGSQMTIGWVEIILGILVVLTQIFLWAGWLQYIWGVLVIIFGIWALGSK